MQVMSNLLYYYGTCGVVKEMLLKRYFSKVWSSYFHFSFQKKTLLLQDI